MKVTTAKKVATKTPAKPAKPAKVPAAKPATKAKEAPAALVLANPKTSAREAFATIGARGVCLFTGTRNKQGEVAPLTDHNGKPAAFPFSAIAIGEKVTLQWKGKELPSQVGKAFRAWVSPAGQPVVILPLAQAVKSGLVVGFKGSVDGEAQETFYLPRGYKTGQKLPAYVGRLNEGGRVETFSHPGGTERQAGTNGKLALAKVK